MCINQGPKLKANIMHYYLDVLKKYCIFTGRACRSEFWFFCLINLLILLILEGTVLLSRGSIGLLILTSIVYYIYALIVLIPGIGVSIRRLHDIGKGGGWIFISLVPIIGWIWAIILYATPSDPGENRFGPSLQGDPEV